MPSLLYASLFAALPISIALAQAPASNPAPAHDTMAATAKPKKQLEILTPAQSDPARLLPPPPAAGSPAEALELAQLRQLIAATSAERMTQAKWDDEHEDPAVFDAVISKSIQSMPATWALLKTVQNDADLAAYRGKGLFGRLRPWAVDAALPNCDAGKGKDPRSSYPSGHSTFGYSVGFALAQLLPAKAPAILARAHDYALSREICGAHFRSDTEASNVLGTYVAATILADPRMARRIAAARAELGTK